jgi:hypothetical protein
MPLSCLGMSVRVYRGKHRELGGPSKGLRLVPWLNVLALFVSSALWLFTPADRQDSLFIFILIFLFSTALFHALIWHGFSWAITFGVIAYGISFSALALNGSAGILFGEIAYTYRLGNQLFSVPSILPLFWVAISYFAFTMARRMTFSPLAVIVIGAFFANSAQFALEQVATNAGYWQWLNSDEATRTFIDIPTRALLVGFFVFVLILFMASQLPRNDKLSSRPPFAAYLIFSIFCSLLVFIGFDLLINALWIFSYLGVLALLYTFTAFKDR